MHSNHYDTGQEVRFSQLLKDRTATTHRALESLSLSRDIVSDKLTMKRYAEYLQAMHTVVSDVENRVFPIVASVVPGIETRRKVQMIELDLRSVKAGTPSSAEVFGEIPSKAFAVGIFYVVEGSALGGRFILQNIRATLADAGVAYFDGYGNATGRQWKSFVSAMDEFASDETIRTQIIDGANHAFDVIYRLFKNFE